MSTSEPVTDAPVLMTRQIGAVRLLTLNRPQRLNALSHDLHDALHAAVKAAALDESVRVLALTGAGAAFCSGGDIGGGAPAGAGRPRPEQRTDELVARGETVRLLHGMPKPTIAILNGAAAGAGLSLALACDFRVCAEDAVLTTAYAKVALPGDFGIGFLLPRLVGDGKARELLMLSPRIKGDEALRIGLVTACLPKASVVEAGLSLAARLAEGPAIAYRHMKQSLIAGAYQTFEANIAMEAYAMSRCGSTQDAKEAGAAFRERRAPLFTGA